MSYTRRIEIIKKWIPLGATIVIILFALLVFWGVIDLVMKFLGAGSYFSVSGSDNSLSISSVKDRNAEMSGFLKERTQKRQDASVPQTLGSEEKDPFNLP